MYILGSSVSETIGKLNGAINSFVWGPVMLLLIMATGLFLTCFLKGIQFTKIPLWLKSTIGSLFGKEKKKTAEGAVTPFQALSTALASTIGVGNIAGVATAIFSGGPGAVFWMWLSALVGMATKYSEVVLAIKYREKNEAGEWVGGPMYYIKNGFKNKQFAKVMSILFACFAVLASFGIGNMSQSNSIATALFTAFKIPSWITGIVVAVIVGLIIIGGIKRIVSVTEKLVPFMGLFYLFFGLIVIFTHLGQLGGAFGLIFGNAFNLKAAGGGVLGYTLMQAMRFGVARGVFSNEAGLGSAPIAHAAADTDSPVRQGLWGIFEVFADTIVVCTITALTIVMSGLWMPENGLKGVDLSMAAFSWALPGNWGSYFIALAVLLFALSTILGWSYYGEKSLNFLFGGKGATMAYRIIFIGIIFVGSVSELTLVWDISDTFNGLMAIPNLISLWLLSSVVIQLTREFFANKPGRELKR